MVVCDSKTFRGSGIQPEVRGRRPAGFVDNDIFSTTTNRTRVKYVLCTHRISTLLYYSYWYMTRIRYTLNDIHMGKAVPLQMHRRYYAVDRRGRVSLPSAVQIKYILCACTAMHAIRPHDIYNYYHVISWSPSDRPLGILLSRIITCTHFIIRSTWTRRTAACAHDRMMHSQVYLCRHYRI